MSDIDINWKVLFRGKAQHTLSELTALCGANCSMTLECSMAEFVEVRSMSNSRVVMVGLMPQVSTLSQLG